MSRRTTLYLMAFATVTLWGASFPLTKAALAWIGPTAIAFLRWSISAAVLFGWLARRGRLGEAWALLRAQAVQVLWVALTGITLFYFLENSALRFTTATNAGVLSNLTSVFIALVAALWLRERPTAIEWGAMATAFAGAALVSQGAGHLTIASAGWLGDGMMIVATLFAALYSIGGKKLVEAYAAEVVLADVALVGAALLLPMTVWEAGGLAGLAAIFHLPLGAWIALLLLGLGAGALANILWLRILGATTATRAGMTLFLIPLISTLLSVFALGESLTLLMVIGGGLVLLGVALVERDRSRPGGHHDQNHGSD
ncbi:MAG: DMT family transporter [Anaerolineae bacterium]|nr:DMT family transporter [Anaerolineae bacterium]